MIVNHPLFAVMSVAVAAPLLAELPVGKRVPVVVLEVILGIVIGPSVLGWLQPVPFVLAMHVAGMAAMLFMAGMEIDFGKIRGRPVILGLGGWVLSAALAFAAVALLHVIPGVHAPMMVTIALTTTILGVLLPMLRDGGELDAPFGRLLMACGTVGEIAPIIAVSLALSTSYSTWREFLFLLAFFGLVGVSAMVSAGARPPRLLALLARSLRSSTQLPVRLALLILAGMVVLAKELGFEGILGAFAAGMVIGLAARGKEGEPFRAKIDAIAFGWLTPFFYVGTGMQFDLSALTRDLTTMLLVPALLVLLLLVRGLPVLLYRRDLSGPERLPFALCSSVASLGLVVVITQIGLHAKRMNGDVAQALVAAALLSLLLYPTLAGVMLSMRRRFAESPGDAM